jgi:Alginate lyase
MNLRPMVSRQMLALCLTALGPVLAGGCGSGGSGTPGGSGGSVGSGGVIVSGSGGANPGSGGDTPGSGGATPVDAGSGGASTDGPAPVDQSPGNDGGGMLPSGTPATVLLDGAQLATSRQQLTDGTASPELKAAFANLIAAAQVALKSGTWTVTSKGAQFVASNDPRMYVSWGPYWWPSDANPPNGAGTVSRCPYVQHDGVRNPNVGDITDRHGLHASSEAIWQLALAWYFSGDSAYADQAELVARTWYLNPTTSMRPEMTYAQQHGPCGTGNAAGLIEASGGYMTDALDGLAILALDTRANGWTAADQTGIKSWMTQFLSWLGSNAIGRGEDAAANNHGTWYDALVASMHLFVGNTAAAKTVVNGARSKRIDAQIMGDGRMPEELSRTTSWHYSNYNVSGLCRLAGTAKHVDVDLWGYQSAGGGSIAKAIAYLIPTATTAQPPGPWAQYNDITEPFDSVYQAESYYSIRAAAEYGKNAQAQAVVGMSPIPVKVSGHFCSGERFPTGSDFCAITKGNLPFSDLQPTSTSAVDMWPLLPTCRMPVN